MPEYLAPGVFVEEVSFRAKSIEGVATSTTGIAGRARFGPVDHIGGPIDYTPRLVVSFTDFERVYGSVDQLDGQQQCYLAHAARAFFLNGGQRLYVSRVYTRNPQEQRPPIGDLDPGAGVAAAPIGAAGAPAMGIWRARWPGRMGDVTVTARAVRSRNVAVPQPDGSVRANGAADGSLVEVVAANTVPPAASAQLVSAALRVVRVAADGSQRFENGTVNATDQLFIVELEVQVLAAPNRTDVTAQLGLHPEHRRYVGSVLGLNDPDDESGMVAFAPRDPAAVDPIVLAVALCKPVAGGDPNAPTNVGRFTLTGGTDGLVPGPDDLLGRDSNPDVETQRATALTALGEIDDIAIVCMPDAAVLKTRDERLLATQYLIDHAERPGAYRIAVVDPPERSSLNAVREFRGKFDSSRAALYYPWIETLDPTQPPNSGTSRTKLQLPPSGFVAGIYARSDIARGVSKAPANEVVQGLTRFEANINTARQQVINVEGINALRFFPGRGNRVWGARTMTSDPEWRYVNVRRFFLFLEHSLDLASQWAVFEPNGPSLWARVSQAIADFLEVQWRDGALLGNTRNEAYFVRCDRSTMSQNDLDNGRLICLVGVAPVRPAEFVIFRVGQFTADAHS